MKHTPGPWKVKDGVIYCADGIPPFDATHTRIDGKGEWEANVHLIAAAPDLLAALEAVEWVPTSDPNWVRCEWCGIVRFKPEQSLTHKPDCQRQAAIAKAKEQP